MSATSLSSTACLSLKNKNKYNFDAKVYPTFFSSAPLSIFIGSAMEAKTIGTVTITNDYKPPELEPGSSSFCSNVHEKLFGVTKIVVKCSIM